jgi:hypothetical protein
MTPKNRRRIRALHALLGSSNEGEREAARRKLDALLTRLGKNWNDLPELLRPDDAPPAPPAADPRDSGTHPFDRTSPADTVRGMLKLYVKLDPAEFVAVTLWIIHTHVYDRFMVTPRLLLSSPVKGCGKSTLLDVCERLVARAEKSDSISAAALYHAMKGAPRTMLLDEADNLELGVKAVLRSVLNAGHKRGGVVTRMLRNQSVRFPVFAPVALAAIGLLTLPLISRSIVINMRRGDSQTMRSLRRFDLADTTDIDIVYSHVVHWIRGANLSLDPEMPDELYGRMADNWRPLLSIADACGPAWSASAREAAIAFAHGDHEEDVGVFLLWCIREVFNARGVDRLTSKKLVRELIGLEISDEAWREYRGPTGSERPRRLTQHALARLLKLFRIRSRVLWPLQQRTAESRSSRGYFRADFEESWRAYCDDENVTTSHPRRLRVVI